MFNPVTYRWVVLGAISILLLGLAAACGGDTEIVEKEVIKEVVATPTPGPTPTPIIIEITKIVEGTPVVERVEVTPTPGPTPTPIIKEVVKEVIVEVTPTPIPPPTSTPPPPLPPKNNPGTMIVATIADPESLDPSWQFDSASQELIFNVYEPLIFYEREKIDKFVPMLSTGWDISEDGLTYTFTIRNGVQFHEGGTLEPHDVAYSFRRGLLQDRSGGPQLFFIEPLLGGFNIKGLATQIAGVDDFADVDAASLVATCERVEQAVTFDDAAGTVTFNLTKPFGPFLQLLTSTYGSIVDMEWMIDQGDWDADCGTWTQWHDPTADESVIFNTMNGTGPFKFERWVPAEEWSIVRNDNYWVTEPLWEGGPSGPATLDRVVRKVVDEWGTRLSMFKAGDADWIFVPQQFLAQIDPLVKEEYEGGEKDGDKLTITNPNGIARLFKNLPVPSADDAYFVFQVDTEGGNPFVGSGALDGLGIPPDFFSDVNVRRGFSYAFDYDTYIEDIWLGNALRRTGPIISGHIGHSPDQPLYQFDLEKAEEEFRLALDGQLWDTGFFLVLTYNSGNDQRRVAAEILEDGIESINPAFKVAVQEVPFSTYLGQVFGQRLPLFFIGWGEDYHHPNAWVTPYMHSQGTIAGLQAFPEELQQQFDSGVERCVVLGEAEAVGCYDELQRLAYESAIDIFITQPSERHYQQLWMDGWFLNPAYAVPYLWYYALSK